jgi:hypothetical protein
MAEEGKMFEVNKFMQQCNVLVWKGYWKKNWIEGWIQGQIQVLWKVVADGLLSEDDALKSFGFTKEEYEALIKEYGLDSQLLEL